MGLYYDQLVDFFFWVHFFFLFKHSVLVIMHNDGWMNQDAQFLSFFVLLFLDVTEANFYCKHFELYIAQYNVNV